MHIITDHVHYINQAFPIFLVYFEKHGYEANLDILKVHLHISGILAGILHTCVNLVVAVKSGRPPCGQLPTRSPIVIRGEPERAPNTRGAGSGFICMYIYI